MSPPFPLWCHTFFSLVCVSEKLPSLFDLAIKRVSSPPLALIVIEGVCIAAKWTCNVISCFFQSLPVGSSPGNSEFPPSQLGCRWRSYVPSKCTHDPGGGGSSQRGKVEGSHTVSTLQPGCLGSAVSLVRLNHLPGCLPPFPARVGTPCAESGRAAAEHTLALLWGCTSLWGGQQPGFRNPHSPRFSFGSSDSWSKCVFLSLWWWEHRPAGPLSLRGGSRELTCFQSYGFQCVGGPKRFLSLLCLTSHLPSWILSCRLRDPTSGDLMGRR